MLLPTEKIPEEPPIEENLNRIIPEDILEARTIEDAISMLRY